MGAAVRRHARERRTPAFAAGAITAASQPARTRRHHCQTIADTIVAVSRICQRKPTACSATTLGRRSSSSVDAGVRQAAARGGAFIAGPVPMRPAHRRPGRVHPCDCAPRAPIDHRKVHFHGPFRDGELARDQLHRGAADGQCQHLAWRGESSAHRKPARSSRGSSSGSRARVTTSSASTNRRAGRRDVAARPEAPLPCRRAGRTWE